MEGQISLGGDIIGKRTIPEGYNDPEILPKKIKREIEPKIEDPELLEKIEDPELLEEEEAGMDIDEDEEDIQDITKQLLNFDFPAYEAGNQFLRIEPKKDEFEDALERDAFMQIYGEQPKLEDLIKATTGAYLPDLQKFQLDPFLTIPAKKQEIEPKIEEAGMDIKEEEDDEEDIVKSILGEEQKYKNLEIELIPEKSSPPTGPKKGKNEKKRNPKGSKE